MAVPPVFKISRLEEGWGRSLTVARSDAQAMVTLFEAAGRWAVAPPALETASKEKLDSMKASPPAPAISVVLQKTVPLSAGLVPPLLVLWE